MARSDNKRMKAFGKRLDEMRKAPAAAVTKTEEDLASKATKGTSVPEMKSTKPGAGMSFKSAFAAARSAGDKTFTWNGKSYTTQLKGEGTKSAPKVTRPAPKVEQKSAPKVEQKVSTPTPKVTAPASLSLASKGKRTAPAAASNAPVRAPASLSLASKGKGAPATPTFEQKRAARLEEWRKAAEAPGASTYVKDRYKYGKETGMVGNFKKGGSVKKYKNGGTTMESDRKPIDTRRAILGSDKEIVGRANRTPYEPIPKKGPDKPKQKLGRAGAAGYKSGGSVMKKGADGIAKKGKTKGMMPKMACGGKGYAKGGSIDGIAKKGKTRCKGMK